MFMRAGSASGSQLGSRTKSQESLTSVRPPSQAKSPGDVTDDSPGSVAVGDPVREPTPVPQTRYRVVYLSPQSIYTLIANSASCTQPR